MGTEDVLKRKGTNHNFTLRHELAHCNGWKHPNTTNGKKFNVGDRWDEAEGAKWVPANTKVSMPKLPTSTRILPASPPVICVTPEWKPEPCKNRNAPIVGGQTVTKLLLASVLAIASTTAYSAEWTREQSEGNWGEPAKGKPWDIVCAERHLQDGEAAETPEQKANYDRCIKSQPAQVTVTPQYYGPPPIGWVYG